jgi:hypothetical protein
MRDLQDVLEPAWKSEQALTEVGGWGQSLLTLQQPAGTWAGGIYGPKWTGTTYTMLLLRVIGIPPGNEQMAIGAAIMIDNLLDPRPGKHFDMRFANLDDCVTGMVLSINSLYGHPDRRLDTVADHLVSVQMRDGGWNCARKRREAVHGSVHTTLNVLDGLRSYEPIFFAPASSLSVASNRPADA